MFAIILSPSFFLLIAFPHKAMCGLNQFPFVKYLQQTLARSPSYRCLLLFLLFVIYLLLSVHCIKNMMLGILVATCEGAGVSNFVLQMRKRRRG